MEYEFYSNYYLKIREDGAITDAWSDGPFGGRSAEGYILFGRGRYQLRLTIDGRETEENPPLTDGEGIPLYKWDGEAVHKRTEEEIGADRAKLPPQAPSPLEKLRAEVEQARSAASVAFVIMAERGDIDGTTAGEHAEVFAQWTWPEKYAEGQIRRYGGRLYRCAQGHTSQSDWTPETAASLWTPVADPAEEWPEWSQPAGAHDAYGLGDRVSHNGERWTSAVENNVWEPGVYGWTRAEQERSA